MDTIKNKNNDWMYQNTFMEVVEYHKEKLNEEDSEIIEYLNKKSSEELIREIIDIMNNLDTTNISL